MAVPADDLTDDLTGRAEQPSAPATAGRSCLYLGRQPVRARVGAQSSILNEFWHGTGVSNRVSAAMMFSPAAALLALDAGRVTSGSSLGVTI